MFSRKIFHSDDPLQLTQVDGSESVGSLEPSFVDLFRNSILFSRNKEQCHTATDWQGLNKTQLYIDSQYIDDPWSNLIKAKRLKSYPHQ